MSVGKNYADHATHYFNAQLGALWENALSSVKEDRPDDKPDLLELQYEYAFAEYWFGKQKSRGPASSGDFLFHASFGKPFLKFHCNHELLFCLVIEDGHYKTDSSKASESAVAYSNVNEELRDVEISLRIPFSFTTIDRAAAQLGLGDNAIRLLVLDMPKAQLHSIPMALEPGRQALTTYLQAYLRTLQAARYHVLFDLPQFSDCDRHQVTDYSFSIGNFTGLDQLCGVSVERINKYLSMAWLKAALLAGTSEARDLDMPDPGASLAEYKSIWNCDVKFHFHLKFAAPRISVLCSEEVVLTFNVDEALFYESDDFDRTEPLQTFFGWKLAFLLNVKCDKSEDGTLSRCRLDLSSVHGFRYMEHLSEFPGYEVDEDENDFSACLIDFFNTEYFTLLESSEYHIIFDSGPLGQNALNMGATDDDDTTRGGSNETRWKEIIDTSEMHGFDMITAISQRAINNQFKSMWGSSKGTREESPHVALSCWKYQSHFESEFQPITVRLLSEDAAIIWIQLESGFLKTLKPSDAGVEYKFEQVHLAFEVPLVKCAHAELPGATAALNATFETSPVYRDHIQNPDCDLSHVCLNLEGAQFLLDLSRLEGLFADDMRQPVDRVQAMLTFVRDHYFKELMSSGHHVIHTMPVWRRPQELFPFALTNTILHVHSDAEITRHTFMNKSRFREPVVIIAGMTDDKPIPASKHNFPHWVARAARFSSQGVVCLSADIYLKSRVLDALASVNAATTLIPCFTGANGDRWPLSLVSWSEHPARKHQPSAFVVQQDSTDPLRYEWQHQENWTYEHSGSVVPANETYSVSCTTENVLEIPTGSKSSNLEIRLSGAVRLGVGFSSVGAKASSTSSVTWSSTLAIHSQAGGLNVNVVTYKPPQYESQGISGDPTGLRINSETLLRRYFPTAPNLEGVLGEFRTFEGYWQACYGGHTAFTLSHPVFNCHGDLLFELRNLRGQQSPTSPRSPHNKSFRSQTGSASPRTRLSQIRTNGTRASLGQDAGGMSSPARQSGYSPSRSPATTRSPYSAIPRPVPRPYSPNQPPSRPESPIIRPLSAVSQLSGQSQAALPQIIVASPVASRMITSNVVYTEVSVQQTVDRRWQSTDQPRGELEVMIPAEPNGLISHARESYGKAAASRPPSRINRR